MNRIIANKETGWSAIGNGTNPFALAEAFYFEKPYLIEVGIQATLPAGIQVRVVPSNGSEVLIIDSATPIGTIKFNYPTSSVAVNVERVPESLEEGPFTGSYSMCISVYGE